MTDQLVKKKCCTCGEEKVKVLYFIDANNKCRDCRKKSNQASKKKWQTVSEYTDGHFFGGNWKPRKPS